MHPILLKLGPVYVYSYGAMVAIGFAVAAFFIYRRAPKFGLDGNKMVDMTVFILLAGIAGARIVYVILNLDYYLSRPLEVINLSKGGLVWYGGFLGAIAMLTIYLKKHKLNFWLVADLIVPFVALAQSFGRVGCFLNGCCYGLICPGDPAHRYPVQLYSAAALAVIFVILRLWQDRRRFLGEIFLGYCMLYSFKRFFMEFLRGDNPKLITGLTLSQNISVVVFIIAAVLFIIKVYEWKKKNSNSK